MKRINLKNYQDPFKWRFGAYPFFTSVYLKAASGKLKNGYYNDYRVAVNFFQAGDLIILQPKKGLLRVGKMIIREALSGGRGYLKELLLVHKEMKTAITACLRAKEAGDYGSLDKWWWPTEKALSHVSGMFFCFDFTSEIFLNSLREKNKKDFARLNDHIVNKKLSFMDEANEYLLDLVDKHPNDFHKSYLLFMKKFSWFQNSYEGKFMISEAWLKKYFKNIKERKFEQGDSREQPDRLPEKYRIIAELINESIIFKDDKKKLLLLVVDLLEPWLKDVCQKNREKYEDLRWLGFDEVLELLKNKRSPYRQKAKEYQKAGRRIGMMSGKGYDDIAGKDFLDKIFPLEKNVGQVREIRGFAASLGFFRGRVRIILNARKNPEKFKKGEILVTSMTRPEYLPLMSRASAFVTDEGGVACHAAIVAREMKKPCIIGTKIATKVLHDGDLVEVDADKGIVKILNEK